MESPTPLMLRKMDRIAASRQKSCNACVRGKRKCDKKTPRCTRCAAKGLDCIYQKLPPGATFHDDDDHIGAPAPPSELHDFDMGFDINSLGTSTNSSSSTTSTTSPENLHNNSVPTIQLDSNLDFSLIDHLMANANQSSAGTELWNLNDFGQNKMEIPPVSSQAPTAIRDLSLLHEMDNCMAFNPLDVHDPRTGIGFVVDTITHLYRDFSRTRTLPFIHPNLYGPNLPRTIMSAFCASTAYAARTSENKAWVFKLISDIAKDIHREGEHASTPVEKLARVQAMTILDSIRVYDGDVALRAASERETPQYIAWVKSLQKVQLELEEGVSSTLLISRDRPPVSWENWVLLESTRRSLMMAFSFLCLTSILKSLEPPCDIMEAYPSFTVSRHLWEAKSSVQFFQAWHHKPQFCVTGMNFRDVWMHARPDDVDEFTKVMLTAQAGPDAMEYFMEGASSIAVSV